MARWRALQNCWIVCSSLAEFCIWLIPGHFGALKKPSVMQPYSTWILCAQDLNLTSSPHRAATFAERCWSIGSMYNKWVGRGTCVAVHSAGTRTKRCEFGVLMKTLFINHQPPSAKSFLTSTSRQKSLEATLVSVIFSLHSHCCSHAQLLGYESTQHPAGAKFHCWTLHY